MKKTAILITAIILSIIINAQVAPDKYWVRFTDKNNSPYSIDNPEEFLTPRAIQRRAKQGIPIVENDLPVNPSYVQAVANEGATILTVSKWMNSVTVFTTSSSVINAINALSFVQSISKGNSGKIQAEITSGKPFFENESYSDVPSTLSGKEPLSGQSYSYGSASNQIAMLNGIALHDLGYNGTGMVIAILDAGFTNADTISAFDSLWNNNRILGYKDFVSPLNPNIFHSHTHGTSVLSTMGANWPDHMVGTTPQASFWLLRSEDGSSEYLIEELNWVSAAEFADSVGADVINSSLGYTTFDDPSQNHTYQDMDGNTTPITIGADLAASKGILVVNSAGNSGNSSWHYIGAPADGDSVFSIGAVNSFGNYVSFSSTGPTYDGRVKPNVVAQGQGSAIINAYTGGVSFGSGTSFSSPITAGMVACLWQAHPDKTNYEIMQAIQQTASQANDPDSLLGYGIPDYLAAHNLLGPAIHTVTLDIHLWLEGPFNGTAMQNDLNSILPLSQPYSSPPFNYAGSENVAAVPSTDIVDWILVSLRDAPSAAQAVAATTVATRAAFIKTDGSVADTSGTGQLSFQIAVTDSLYLVIQHRNHLSVMSAIALKNSGGNNYAYDFTSGSEKTFGGASGIKEMGPGLFGLVAGDSNADGVIGQSDKDINWAETAGSEGYTPADLNMDGQADNPDKNEKWLTNLGRTTQVPE